MSEKKEGRHSIRVTARLEFEYRVQNSSQVGYIEDLSETGAYVDTPQPLPNGTTITFSFRLPDNRKDEPITGSATVVRSEPPVGMAIHFDNFKPDVVDRLRFYVAAVYFEHDPSELI